MVAASEIVSALNTQLGSDRFRDYCVNGLQVAGTRDVRHVVTGVSAHLAFLDAALAADADLIVVHHGLFWNSLGALTGILAERVRRLMQHGVALCAYHLPLDAHPELGNNAGLAAALGVAPEITFGDVRGVALGVAGPPTGPMSLDVLVARITDRVSHGRPPFVFAAPGERPVARVGLCTGAASDLLEAAAAAGCDAFVTGELAERAGETARELGIHLIAAGHHATEVFGPQRVAAYLAREFGPRGVTATFIDSANPL